MNGLPGRALPRYSADLVACRLYHSVDQTIATSTEVVSALDSVEYDFGGLYPIRDGYVRIPYSGLYAIAPHIRWSGNNVNQRTMRVRRNGTTHVLISSLVANGGSANGPRQGDYGEMILEANDQIHLNVFQDSGASLTLLSAFAIDGAVPVGYPSLSVRLITKL